MQRGLGRVRGVLFLSANHLSLVVYQNNVFLNTHSCSSANDADGSAPSAMSLYGILIRTVCSTERKRADPSLFWLVL